MKHSESILQNPPVCTVPGLAEVGISFPMFCISEEVFRLNAMTAKIIIIAMTATTKYIEILFFFSVFFFLGIVSPLQHKCCFCRNFREDSIQ